MLREKSTMFKRNPSEFQFSCQYFFHSQAQKRVDRERLFYLSTNSSLSWLVRAQVFPSGVAFLATSLQ